MGKWIEYHSYIVSVSVSLGLEPVAQEIKTWPWGTAALWAATTTICLVGLQHLNVTVPILMLTSDELKPFHYLLLMSSHRHLAWPDCNIRDSF